MEVEIIIKNLFKLFYRSKSQKCSWRNIRKHFVCFYKLRDGSKRFKLKLTLSTFHQTYPKALVKHTQSKALLQACSDLIAYCQPHSYIQAIRCISLNLKSLCKALGCGLALCFYFKVLYKLRSLPGRLLSSSEKFTHNSLRVKHGQAPQRKQRDLC